MPGRVENRSMTAGEGGVMDMVGQIVPVVVDPQNTQCGPLCRRRGPRQAPGLHNVMDWPDETRDG
jgi:hypothetical protein